MHVGNVEIRKNWLIAGVVALVMIVWIGSGQIGGNKTNSAGSDGALAGSGSESVFRVRAQIIQAQRHTSKVIVRGKTEAVRSVDIRSETAGTVLSVPIKKGASVTENDIICELAPDARQAELAQAQAMLRQATLEYQAADKLFKKGHRSETQLAAAEAARDAAQAATQQKEIELDRTKIRAPFDGILDDRLLEIGDYAQPGTICGRVVDIAPILIVGQISERDVSKIKTGDQGLAVFVGGQAHEGTIRFVGTTAAAATRTFRVELEVDNANLTIRDGITADIHVSGIATLAHKISPAILTLDETGLIGVRTVDQNNIVEFHAVVIIESSLEGIWVTGLPEKTTVITVGQEFVVPGEKVDVVLDADGAHS